MFTRAFASCTHYCRPRKYTREFVSSNYKRLFVSISDHHGNISGN
jgi:hypothetical protein